MTHILIYIIYMKYILNIHTYAYVATYIYILYMATHIPSHYQLLAIYIT